MARATRIALDMALEASKTLKPAIGIAWQYAKTEIVPPLTMNFFHGPMGKSLEESFSRAADNVIVGMKNRIQEIEAERLREIKRKEDAAKALIEKVKADAKRKAEEIAKKLKTEAANTAQVGKITAEAQKAAKQIKQVVTKKVETISKRRPPKKRRDGKKVSPSTNKK